MNITFKNKPLILLILLEIFLNYCYSIELKKDQTKIYYYNITLKESNNFDGTIEQIEYDVYVQKRYNKVLRILISRIPESYLIEWITKNDSIYISYYFDGTKSSEIYHYSKLNYQYSLNNLELYQNLPESPGFKKHRKRMVKNSTRSAFEYKSIDSSGLMYYRENKQPKFIDTLVWKTGIDIKYLNTLKITSRETISYSSKYLDLIVPTFNTSKIRDSIAVNNKIIEDFFDDLNDSCKYYLLDFWYIHCQPCRRQLQEISDLDSIPDNICILALNVFDNQAEIVKFKLKYNLDLTLLKCDKDVKDYFRIKSYPTTLLINRDMQILWERIGYSSEILSDLRKLKLN